MATKDKKDLFSYKPSNPKDPKMPSLNEKERKETKKEEKIDFNNYFETFESSSNKEPDNDLIEGLNSKTGRSVIDSLKKTAEQQTLELTLEEKKEQNSESKLVLPDPKSNLKLTDLRDLTKKVNHIPAYKDTKAKMDVMRSAARIKLSEKEQKLIVNAFKHKVIKITSTEIILKNDKFGFEIYKNNINKRYWVATLIFEEIWDPRKLNFTTFWTGNSFIGYGFKDLNETIDKTFELMRVGRTGNVMWKDFVVDWNKQKNRFIASTEPKQFTFDEYKKIINWWNQNKIWICVKQAHVKDYEDFMEEQKEKKLKGEALSPLAGIQAKMIDPPRKARAVFGYPVANPKYKGKDFDRPENKLYEIGFSFSE